MTGSTPYLIEKNDIFNRSFKKLSKSYKSNSQKDQFLKITGGYLEGLTDNPYLVKTRSEPVPTGFKIQEGWTFHKLVFRVGKGASGQIRLMYLVHEQTRIIRPVWIYNHEQFKKRPPDKDLKNVMTEILND